MALGTFLAYALGTAVIGAIFYILYEVYTNEQSTTEDKIMLTTIITVLVVAVSLFIWALLTCRIPMILCRAI